MRPTQRQVARAWCSRYLSLNPDARPAVQSFQSAWEDLTRKKAASNGRVNSNSDDVIQWTGAGGPELGAIFTSRNFSSNELNSIQRILGENAGGDIYGDQDRPYLESEVEIVDRQRPTDRRQATRPVVTMTSLSEARAKLRSSVEQDKKPLKRRGKCFYNATALIQPNGIYDSSATERQEAAAAGSGDRRSVSNAGKR